MRIRQIVQSAFSLASVKYPDIHKVWVTASYHIGGKLPASRLVMSVQLAGELDVLLRCMEDELGDGSSRQEGDFSDHYQIMFSELWVSRMYEIVRLLKSRKLVSGDKSLDILAHHLRLLRIPIDKHEIPGDKSLKTPVTMKSYPSQSEADHIYEYSKDDTTRSHIMPGGVSKRGSAMWQVLDLTSNESYWVERRELSERMLAIFGVSQKDS